MVNVKEILLLAYEWVISLLPPCYSGQGRQEKEDRFSEPVAR